jgi:hypothetical protein
MEEYTKARRIKSARRGAGFVAPLCALLGRLTLASCR